MSHITSTLDLTNYKINQDVKEAMRDVYWRIESNHFHEIFAAEGEYSRWNRH